MPLGLYVAPFVAFSLVPRFAMLLVFFAFSPVPWISALLLFFYLLPPLHLFLSSFPFVDGLQRRAPATFDSVLGANTKTNAAQTQHTRYESDN